MKQRFSFFARMHGRIYIALRHINIEGSFQLIVIGLFFTLNATAQNPMLPLPNNQYVYFDGTGNQSIIKSLPIHNFQMSDGTTLIPTDENMLQAAYEENNELFLYYRGQPAKYCQTIVPDKNGDILFFIVDNNIYNKNGESFFNTAINDFLNNYPLMEYDEYSYLLNGTIDGSEYFDQNDVFENSNTNRFPSIGHYVFDPNLLVVPINGTCNEFILFYYFQLYIESGGFVLPHVMYRKIKILSNDNAYIYPAKTLIYSNNSSCCNANKRVSIASTNYRSQFNDILLFVRFWDKIYTFSIGSDFCENTPTPKEFFLGLDINSSFCAEMEVRHYNNFGYLLTIPVFSDLNNDLIYRGILFPVDYNLFPIHSYSGSESMENITYPTPLLSNYFKVPFNNETFPRGMEYSPDGNTLFLTYTNPNTIKYLSNPLGYVISGIPDWTNYLYNLSGLNTNHQYSMIEKGADNKIYLPFYDNNSGNSGITCIQSPNNINLPEISYDFFNNIDCFYSNNYGNPLYQESKKTILLSNQIDNFNWNEFYNSIPQECCVQYFMYNEINNSFSPLIVYENDNIVVKSGYNGTWSPTNNPFINNPTEIFIKNDLIIERGAKVIIQDLTFRFNESKGVYLNNGINNKGAELILNNSVLTAFNACNIENTIWQGVTLNGSYYSQSPISFTTQPRIVLLNNSMVEYAQNGIYAGLGGIVQANDTRFKDNITAVRMFNFQGTQYSYFKNCTFNTTSQLYAKNVNPISFINLWYCHGVKFYWNIFENISSQPSERGVGILSTGSNFTVKGKCNLSSINGNCSENEITPNLFKELDLAIKASIGTYIYLDKNRFVNNHKGVFLQAYEGTVNVTRNYFDVGSSVPDYSYGLYLHGCTNYKVDENTFENGVSGMFVNNCGPIQNKAYKNTFRNFTDNAPAFTALYKNNDNGDCFGCDGRYGTEVKCNTFLNNKYNICIIGTNQYFSNISRLQGEGTSQNTSPANNWLDHSSTLQESDFYVRQSDVNYMYFYPQNNGINYNYMLQAYTISTISNIEVPNVSPSCPSRLTSPISITNLNTRLQTLNQEISDKQSELDQLIDNNNTEYFLDYIEILKPNNFNTLYNQLMQVAPYLSDTVLIAFMTSPINKPAHKKNVVEACSPLPNDVRRYINQMNINQNFKDQLLALQTGTNPREEKEYVIIELTKDRAEILKSIMETAMGNDSVPEVRDSLRNIMALEGDMSNKLNYLRLLFDMSYYKEATDLANNIQAEINYYPEPRRTEIEQSLFLNRLMISSLQTDIHDTISLRLWWAVYNNKRYIQTIANNPTHRDCALAQALLNVTGQGNYIEEILLPEPSTLRSMSANVINNNSTQTNSYLSIYPIPADEIIIIESNMELTGEIVIFNTLGQVEKRIIADKSLKVIIPVNELKNGLYYLKYNNIIKTISVSKQ